MKNLEIGMKDGKPIVTCEDNCKIPRVVKELLEKVEYKKKYLEKIEELKIVKQKNYGKI